MFVDSLGQSLSLSDVRLAASCLLAFAGFLRFNEFSSHIVVMSGSQRKVCQCA